MNAIILLLLCICSAEGNEIQYQILEEVQVETVIGNLYKNAFPSTNQNDQLIILNGKDKAVNCFKINDRGELVVARKMDRDMICKKLIPALKSEISLNEECKITLQVASQSNNMIVRVVIIIEDKNDNAPKWSQDRIDIKFIDGCKERTKVTLPYAYDNDIGQNAQIEYTIKERDLPFRINIIDGLYLETLQSLDREARELYKFTITATDKGHPAKSNEIDVFVTIEDINDNSPTFSQAIYRFKAISESSPVGSIIGKLEASDSDSGVNGKFHFKFGNSVSTLIKHYFSVHSDGIISINSPLDCDRGESQFKFKAIVEDEALRPYSRFSEATVVITINDVNDEIPEIKLIFMNRDPRTNIPFIIEHSRVGTLIGILEVNDPDFKGNDAVVCRDTPNFSLIHEDRQSKYKIVTNIEFDREKATQVMLTIICQDGVGNRASSNLSIVIKDINDNSPTFSKSLYVAKVRENMPIGTQLSEKVTATDPDGDSLIQYSIMKQYAMNFSVNRDNGIISTKVTFDREECNTYIIKVLATDATHGIINTGTGTVQLLILDENDNKPIFTNEFFTFHLTENNLPPTKVGLVEATDEDSADQPKSLKYSLDYSIISRNFQIDQRSGIIRAMTSLDREKMTHYIFPVFVEDGQNTSPLRHIATSTVTIIVDDVNDNSPKFLVPNSTKNSFEISVKETIGHKITYITAEDPDYLDNSRISYSITYGNDLSLFSIDPTSGLLFLSDSLQSPQHNSRQFYLLTVTACDSGKPRPLCTDFKNLRIIIKNGINILSKNQDVFSDNNVANRPNNAHQEAIIICLAIVFITLLVSSAALLVLMKCKPSLVCRRSTRTTSKDKRFELCVNSQMLPTVDANVKDKDIDEAMRNFCSENSSWQSQDDQSKLNISRFGYAVDHTNRPDYQRLESLCLASSMRCTPQPRFVDPCPRFHTLTPFAQSTSFLSQHDLKRIKQQPVNSNDMVLSDGHNHIYQSVEDDNVVHLYSRLNENKKESKYNINEHNINPNPAHDYGISSNNDKDNKYMSYTFNEASFV